MMMMMIDDENTNFLMSIRLSVIITEDSDDGDDGDEGSSWKPSSCHPKEMPLPRRTLQRCKGNTATAEAAVGQRW